MTGPQEPFRPDVWGDRPRPPAGSVPPPGGVPDTGTGRPLDLSQDPDRVVPGRDLPPAAGPDTGSGRPLDLSQDPDRFVAGAPPVVPTPAAVPRRLDPARDPDRYGGPGDRTLTDLLGEGAQEEERDTYVWLGGLLSVLAFLALVAFLARFLGP